MDSQESLMSLKFNLDTGLVDIKPEDNPDVFCDRCQKTHKKYTFTQHDYDNMVYRATKEIADTIDTEIITSLKAEYGSQT